MTNSPPRQLAFWSRQELADLLPRFSELFSITDFRHDSENEWEWFEGVSDDLLRVHVSRYHNLDENSWLNPIVISLGFGNIPEEQYIDWAGRLAEALNVEIAMGYGQGSTGAPDYRFIIKQTFRPSN